MTLQCIQCDSNGCAILIANFGFFLDLCNKNNVKVPLCNTLVKWYHSNCDVVTGSRYSGHKALKMTEGNAKVCFSFDSDSRQKYVIYVVVVDALVQRQ